MKKLFFLLIIFSNHYLFSQTEIIPQKKTQKAFAKIDFLSIKMPETQILNEPNMGFSGIHYNLMLNDLFYSGVGIYGSISGIRGGFFTLGVNAGIKKNISDNFYFDTGFHFGGGGGAGAPDGGGAFILPHFNLGYNFKNFSINSGWSYVNFFDNGLIKNHQLNFSLEVPLDITYTDYKYSDNEINISDLKNTSWNKKSTKNSLTAHFNNLKVLSKAKATTGEILEGKTIKLAGFEFASYLNHNWFAFLKVDGAYDGIRAGYMDVLLGSGYNFHLNKNRTNIIAKFGIGAGGGGGVDTKGGVLIYPDISIEQQIFKDFFISINKGFLLTPKKDFYTSTFGVGLKYYVQKNGIINDNTTYTQAKFKGIEVIVKQDLYFDAKRMINKTEDLHQISLQINLNLNKNIFIAGQTSFADFGNAGAYAEGIVGLGIKSNLLFNNTTSVFTQFLAGGSGGGNISTGQGLILKPALGFNYKLNDKLNIRTSGGYIKAIGGKLNSPFINVGINYNLSFLTLK